jgi:hypothetical protein
MALAQGIICLFRNGLASSGNYMTDSNLNFWGELVVPAGVSICFGFALLVWLRDEIRAEPEDNEKDRR